MEPIQNPSQQVRGPRQLLEWLIDCQPTAGLYLLGLNSERRVITLDRRPAEAGVPKAWPHDPLVEHWVPVYVLDDASEIDAIRVSAPLERLPESPAALDFLITDRARWWSAMCTDVGCCPAEGRELGSGPRSSGQFIESTDSWRSALQGKSPVNASALISSLEDVAMRDAVLVALRDRTLRRRWRRLYAELEDASASADLPSICKAALLSADATSRLLDGDTTQARTLALKAKEHIPEYSYSNLLLTALASGSPRELLSEALRAASKDLPGIDLVKSPRRIARKNESRVENGADTETGSDVGN